MEEDLDDVDEEQHSMDNVTVEINPDVDIKQENEEIKEEDDELSSSLQNSTKVSYLCSHLRTRAHVSS